MLPAQSVIPGALATVLSKAPLTQEKVALAWRLAVGATLSRATTVRLDGYILRVQTTEPAWRREIEKSAGIICRRLVPFLGKNVVRSLDVVLKKTGASPYA